MKNRFTTSCHEAPLLLRLAAGALAGSAMASPPWSPVKGKRPAWAAASHTGYTPASAPHLPQAAGTRPDLPCCRLRRDPAATLASQLLNLG